MKSKLNLNTVSLPLTPYHPGASNPQTVREGLRIQAEHLSQWRQKLNAECYTDLVAYVEKQNAKLTRTDSLYEVYRGASLDRYISNWTPTIHP